MTWTTAQQDALQNAIQRRNERNILQNQLAQTKTELAKRQQEQAVLLDQWRNEQADVDRLNRLSWASLYHDLLNQKEQQLTKEEAEAQHARLRYDAICATVIALQQQCKDQEKRLPGFSDVDQLYEQLIESKREALLNSSDAVREQYQQHLTTLIHNNHYAQELTEAKGAGIQALQEVRQLGQLLDEARTWGTWDMLGGSTISSMIKYRKLDEVRDQSQQVAYSLQQFRREYKDVDSTFLPDWTFDNNLTRFVDIFFDNIFTDWSVQSRINEARTTAQTLEDHLVTAIAELQNQQDKSTEQTKQLSDQFQRFLETV
ncbi:hypothetical protein [Spirosoma fluviale]|uniref:Uncharacterized protein n=1 Tax=Spirosoma fluviale TaxID=1597977 RepID=A0A286GVL9_9BACT|nr:hypothetical protein [Spirosoma fluviale]SOD99540.1 hypothetical protein SAMN06269250_0038 [Spirosoma fluviale]